MSTPQPESSLRPFGEVSCEKEVRKLGTRYQEYFLNDAPFNEKALKKDCYLIIGRRGSGKTTLANYFGFQQALPNCQAIDVDEPNLYADLLRNIADRVSDSQDLAVAQIAKVWEFLIWNLIFDAMRERDPEIKAACRIMEARTATKPVGLLVSVLQDLIGKFLLGDRSKVASNLTDLFGNARFVRAKERALELTPYSPVIVAIDSLEHYSVRDAPLMRATAALVECAETFNSRYSDDGIHIKVFLPAEVYPRLQEDYISNPLKFAEAPLHLHWRPKELITLICYRFHHFLSQRGALRKEQKSVNWERFNEVRDALWNPYMGREITNANGTIEHTFPYVLRHTQLRPRQLVTLCNAIAAGAMEQGDFPRMQQSVITQVIRDREAHLANEVLNAYNRTYEGVADIVAALSGLPSIFTGNELDIAARRSARSWLPGEYSPQGFLRLVAELGIVGRVREVTSRNFVMADFEYAIDDRLTLQERDECVIHPMFYRKLNTKVDSRFVVYPFPEQFNGILTD